MKRIVEGFKRLIGRGAREPQALRLNGVPDAPVTAEPDDAELAAQALLELLAERRRKGGTKDAACDLEEGTEEYYRRIAEKIRLARETARLRTLRFLSYAEDRLNARTMPATGEGSLALLETELYKRIDTVEREGGELKRRWQHCLAEVTVRIMQGGMTAGETDTKET